MLPSSLNDSNCQRCTAAAIAALSFIDDDDNPSKADTATIATVSMGRPSRGPSLIVLQLRWNRAAQSGNTQCVRWIKRIVAFVMRSSSLSIVNALAQSFR